MSLRPAWDINTVTKDKRKVCPTQGIHFCLQKGDRDRWIRPYPVFIIPASQISKTWTLLCNVASSCFRLAGVCR